MAASPTPRYAELPPARGADELERELLERWRAERLFERTLTEREGGPSFVFFEGPPTANGRPGIHHVFSRTIKDLFCRHRAAKGFHVLRKAGWDTHGLPVEIEVEKQLGISGKQQIEQLGVAEFNRRCRESVFTYKDDWERLSERIAYWLDYGDPYVTYSNDYVESVWWALKTLFDKGLLSRGHKILPYCPRCGTALSSHEVAQGYEDVEDPSVYVALNVSGTGDTGLETPASGPQSRSSSRRILVWTTTPWTLVSNAALAVHPDLAYVELQRKGKDEGTLILAEARVAAVLGADWESRWEPVGRLTGADMLGWRYERPFDWLEYPEGKAHEVIVPGDFVSADDGSGVVHLAPAFGADDYAAGKTHDLAFLQPVNARGEFPADLPVAGGMFVKKADPLLIEELKRRGVLFRAGTLTHSYPHCWRCHTPLLYYARGSWFVRTTAYRDEMLARNDRVDWHPPEVGAGRFGEWLVNNVDWAISRDRFWGTPLPLWVCDAELEHAEAIGSYADLAARSGRALPADFDPHKPFIDAYHWPCARPGCGGTMRRVPEVIDTWFDSGSMSFAQWHYPFENRDLIARQYPADFICEGIDQTRGWFYSLLAIAAGLGDALPNNGSGLAALGSRPAPADSEGREPKAESTRLETAPYRSVVVNDLIRAADGKKMSKHLGNTVDPWRVLGDYGADAVRFFLVATADVSVPRNFDERAIREQSVRFFLTLKNVYSGVFAQYANFGWTPGDRDPAPARRPLIDRWLLSRLAGLEAQVDAALDAFDATLAARAIAAFVDGDLANWYVRRSRDRFYEVDGDENRAAFATLHEALVVTCRLLAPFAPFLTDWMHRELTGQTVHLAPFTRAAAAAREPALETAMAAIRELATLGRAAREDAKIKVRQPLERAVCVAPGADPALLESLVPLLAAELNVKRVEFASSGDALVTLSAKANFRALGKKFGKKTPLAAAAIAALPSDDLRAFEAGAPLAITVEGETRELSADDLEIQKTASGELLVQGSGGFVTAIDPSVTEALRLEGLAREVISRVQRLRKESGLAVSDRIRLGISGDADVAAAVAAHGEWIRAEVLATEIRATPGSFQEYPMRQDLDLDGVAAHIAFTRTE